MAADVNNDRLPSAGDGEGSTPVLDQLYHELASVTTGIELRQREAEQAKADIERLEQDLITQREVAVQRGDRSAYDLLSKQLAMLTRAYRLLEHDPDEDPVGSYDPASEDDDADPTDPDRDGQRDERRRDGEPADGGAGPSDDRDSTARLGDSGGGGTDSDERGEDPADGGGPR